MASVFVIFGVTPFSDSLCPNQFTSCMKKCHFDSLWNKFSFLALSRQPILVFQAPFLTILKLSIYHLKNRRCFSNCSEYDPMPSGISPAYQPNRRIRSKLICASHLPPTILKLPCFAVSDVSFN